MSWLRIIAASALLAALWPQAAAAQSNTATPAAQADEDDPDRDLRLSQPDFTVVNLPTTLRLPRYKSAFRVTHRFGRPLGAGDFGDLAGDLFGIDSGAQIGLEYRFGIIRGGQIGIHRTSDKTIEFFTRYSVLQQRTTRYWGSMPSRRSKAPTTSGPLHAVARGCRSRASSGNTARSTCEPMWVNNSNPLPSELVDDNDTFILGLRRAHPHPSDRLHRW